MTAPVTVGVLVNPASGRDIRRLTAHASVFPTAEKANMAVRLLAGLGALGVDRVLTLRDGTGVAGLVLRALNSQSSTGRPERWPQVQFLDLPISQSVADTHAGIQYMVEQKVALIAALGGDGTQRAVAAHCGATPVLSLSTGTNNAFPEMREATLAGMAGALVATGAVPLETALVRNKRLIARCIAGPNRGREEIALVDICVTSQPFIGARAISNSADIQSLFLAFASPECMGLASVGGALWPVGRHEAHGLHLTLMPGSGAEQEGRVILAPIAPGRIEEVRVESFKTFNIGQTVALDALQGSLAFDGEREVEPEPGDRYQIELDWNGPQTVDVGRVLNYAAAHQLLRPHWHLALSA